jgi:serine/threonine protein kinase
VTAPQHLGRRLELHIVHSVVYVFAPQREISDYSLRWLGSIRFVTWVCIKTISKASLARVYKAIDIETGDQVAIKIASVGHNHTFERELRSYRLLNGVAGIPNIRWSGSKLGRHVLVMDWLPADLEYIFRCLPQSFTPPLVAAIARDLVSKPVHFPSRPF